MKLLLVDNVHMYKTSKGEYYTPSIYDKAFFQRYLNVFDSVRLVAKTKLVDSVDDKKLIKVDFPRVEIYELKWYRGIKELIKNSFSIIKQAHVASKECDCVIYRVAQMESFLVFLFSDKKIPFALEVVNDPLSWGDVSLIIRSITAGVLRWMCRKANGVSYVTETYLQSRYPLSKNKEQFTASYSSVDIDETIIASKPREWKGGKSFSIVHVANVIDGNSKGHDTVLRALKRLIRDGYCVNAVFIGDGPSKTDFEKMAIELGVYDYVYFAGRIGDKKKYIAEVCTKDAFVFPSHSEGLPRVVIEAMACGLPCIASPVGGTGELIDDWCLIDYTDDYGYSKAIERLIDTPQLYVQTSKVNIDKARLFGSKRLCERRSCFYMQLRERCKS